MGLFGSILKKSKNSDNSPEALQNVKWGMASPLMVRLNCGIESIRAFGTFSLSISDPSKLKEEGFDIQDENSTAQLKMYLNDLLLKSFKGVLESESSSMNMEDLTGSTGKLAQAVKDDTSTIFSKKGLELSGFVVMKIVKV